MKQYKNYIFDLYGTLADIRTDECDPLLWLRFRLWMAEHGALYESPDALRTAYLSACAEKQAADPDPLYELELRDVFRELFAQKGVAAGDALIAATAVFFRIQSTKKLKLYPWVRPAFKQLRAAGKKIFLLSNAQACFTEPELKALGLSDAFDGIVLSSDAHIKKPSPKIMEELLKTYGLSVPDCLMTGNDLTSDIAVAKAFGMDSLYLQTETSGPYDPAKAGPYRLLDGDWTKLPALLGVPVL